MSQFRKRGAFLVVFFLFLAVGRGSVYASEDTGFNLIQRVTEQADLPGKWVKNDKGMRYRYTASSKYAKNTWLYVGKKIYFVNKKGYRVSGFKRYKKNTYYLDEKGRLVFGWKRIGEEKYYFSKKTGAMLKGWNTVGKKQYFFSDKGVLQKNAWIGGQYVNKKGVWQKAKRIFVGDSRTVGMQKVLNNKDVYIAKWGKGYEWFSASGRKQLEKNLKKYPYSAVIFNLGVNDLENADAYVTEYQELRSEYPKARFYFMSVNPVEETFLRKNGFSGRDNPSIEIFNEKMEQAFGMRYLDTYHWMIENEYVLDMPQGYGTTDGLHYIEIVYRLLYGYVIDKVR